MGAPALPRRDASDHLRAVGDRLLTMEGALAAGDTLADHLRGAVDQYGHQRAPFTAPTIFLAASSRSSAGITFSPDSRRIALPCSTFVPSRRTTSGTCSPTSFTAAMTPLAMMSQRMMPPKILTRMPCTLGSE